MRILIVGAGALGSLLGAKLALAGHAVTLAGRPATVSAVRGEGLILFEPDGCRRVATVSAAENVAAACAGGSHDLALVTVKAFDTAAAVAELRGLGPGSAVLTPQNGVGNEELLAEAFGAGRVISGAINTPVSVPAPGQVRVHRGTYKIGLAPVGGDAAPVSAAAAALSSAGFDVRLYGDYRGLKWTKLLMNILANASCAILDLTPGQVMAHPVAALLEARAWREALAVMDKMGIPPVTLAGYPFPALLPLARRLPDPIVARGLRLFVGGARGSKMPSLHIALGSGKRTEVGWLNGAVARHGRVLGLPTPVNALYADLVAALANGEIPRDTYRHQPERLAELAAR